MIKDMIYAADLNTDNKVDKEEFMRVMKKMKLIWKNYKKLKKLFI